MLRRRPTIWLIDSEREFGSALDCIGSGKEIEHLASPFLCMDETIQYHGS
jgi:hypothetical protein